MKKVLIMLTMLAVFFAAMPKDVSADYYSERTLLYYGMRNNNVYTLQKDLESLGYFNANATGYFGSITKQAVITYQRNNALAADGIVGPQTSREIKTDLVLKTAKQYLGVPYVWGGTSPSGFDCSGFTHYVLLKHGIVIPRTTSTQYQTGTWVQKSNLKPGDLVFFTTYAPGPSHVGFYIGDGKFIHASSGAGKITISELSNSYYSQRYIGAKRVIK